MHSETIFSRINPEQTIELLKKEGVAIIDIRDQLSYNNGHLPKAMHLSSIDAPEFIETHPSDNPLIIYCYHGHSSLNAAHYFASQGLNAVSSMDGGFEQWQQLGLPLAKQLNVSSD